MHPTGRTIAKYGLLGAGGLLLLAALLAAAGVGFLQTGPGQRWLAGFLTGRINAGGAVQVEIRDLSGTIPVDFRAGRIVVLDRQGPWLTVEDLHLDWSPAALLGGRIVVGELTAGSVVLERTPESTEKAPEKRQPPDLRLHLPPFAVRRLQVDRLVLGRELLGPRAAGEDAAFRVAGRMEEVPGLGLHSDLAVDRLGRPATALALDATLREDGVLGLGLRLDEAPGGFLARLAGLADLPGGGPLTLGLDGTGPLSGWQGRLAAGAGGLGSLAGAVSLAVGDTVALAAEGSLAPDPAVEPALRPLLPVLAPFRLRARLTPDDVLVLDELTLTMPDGSAVPALPPSAPPALPGPLPPRTLLADLGWPGPDPSHPPAGAVSAQGRYDLAHATLDVRLALDRGRLAPLAGLTGLSDLAGSFDGAASVAGPADRPAAELTLAGRGLQVTTGHGADRQGVRIERGDVRLGATLLGPLATAPGPSEGSFPGVRIEGGAKLAMIDLAGIGADTGTGWRRLPEDTLDLSLDATYRSADDIDLALLKAEGKHLSLALSGRTRGSDGRARLALEVRELQPLLRFIADGTGGPADISGGLSVTADLAGDFARGDLAGPLKASARRLAGLPGPAAALLGPAADLSAELGTSGWSAFRVRSLALDAARARLRGNGSLDARHVLAADFDLALPDLAVLSPSVGHGLAGRAEARGQVSGSLAATDGLAAGLSLKVQDPSLDGRAFRSVAASAEAKGLPGSPAGTLSIEAVHPDATLTGSSRFALAGPPAGQILRLDDARLQTQGARATGQAAVHLDSGLADGTLQAAVDTLAPLGRMLGLDLAGKGTLSAALSSTPQATKAQPRSGARDSTQTQSSRQAQARSRNQAPTQPKAQAAAQAKAQTSSRDAGQAGNGPRGTQDATLNLAASGLRTPWFGAASLSLKANLADVLGAPRGSGDLAAADLTAGPARIAALTAAATGEPAGFTFRLAAKGRLKDPFSVSAEGRFATEPQGGAQTATVTALSGSMGEFPFRLEQPATLRLAEDGTRLDRLALGLAKGRIEGNFSLAQGQVASEATLTGLPVRVLRLAGLPALTGDISGSLRLSGDPANPTGRVGLDVRGVRVDDPAYASLPALSLAAGLSLVAGRAKAEAEVQGLGDKPVQAEATAPVRLSLRPFAFELPDQGPLSGRVAGRLDLARLASAVPVEDQRLTGVLAVDMAVAGTPADPVLTGRASLDNGVYDNATSGTHLERLRLALESDGRAVTVTSLSGSDGAKGTISGSGRLLLSAGERFPFSLSLTARNARLVRTALATATAGGDIAWSGNLAASTLAGTLTVGPAEVAVPESSSAASVSRLDVIEINGPAEPAEPYGRAGRGRKGQEGQDEGAAGPSFPATIKLDLLATSPGRIFVRGRGLDAEWGGTVQIIGTAAQPVLYGQMSVVRGSFTFLDRRLNLEHGTVFLNGQTPPRPALDIQAQAALSDMTAQILLTGPAETPSISLTSDPTLPQDEILSRLLFGRSMKDITPLQAVQLARAVASLTGTGSRGGKGMNLDIIGSTRKFLRLDELAITSGQSGTPGSMPGTGIPASAPPPGLTGATRRQAESTASTGTSIGVGKYIRDDVFVRVERGITDDTGRFTVEYELSPHFSIDSSVGLNSSTGIGMNWKFDY